MIFAFNKLTELSYEKGKPHNPSLVFSIKAILTTLEYAEELSVDIPTAMYQIRIMIKKSKLLTTEHTDQQLLEEVVTANKDREVKKRSPSLTQSFSSMFKRRNLAVSEASSIQEVDLNMRKSRN